MTRVSRGHGTIFGSIQRGHARVTYERDFELSEVETHKIAGLYLDDLTEDYFLEGDTLRRRIDAQGRGSDWDEDVTDLDPRMHLLIVHALRFRALMVERCVFGAEHRFDARGKCGVCDHQRAKA